VKLHGLNTLWNWAWLLLRLWPAVTALHNGDTGTDVELRLLVYGFVVCFYWHALLLRWRMQSAALAKDRHIDLHTRLVRKRVCGVYAQIA